MLRKHSLTKPARPYKTAFAPFVSCLPIPLPLALIALPLIGLPATVLGASYITSDHLRYTQGEATQYTGPLSDFIYEINSLTLGPTHKDAEIYFDLPPSERLDKLVLTLAADPVGRVDSHAPLQVSLNGGEPVPLHSRGQSFEATITLDTANAKAKRNVLKLVYPVKNDENCSNFAQKTGQWSIDLAQSRLRVATHTTPRSRGLADLEQKLSVPAFAPKTIRLIAQSEHKTALEALAAQAVALRMRDLPTFKISTQSHEPEQSEFNIIMVPRANLSKFTQDPILLNAKGPQLAISREQDNLLFLTADTPTQLLGLVENFATHHIPSIAYPSTTLGAITMSAPLGDNPSLSMGKTKLMDMKGQFTPASGQTDFNFSLDDPAATHGELILRLATPRADRGKSRLRVALNGEALGAVKLNKARKSVAFNISAERLNGADNILSLRPEPDYVAAGKISSCAPVQEAVKIGRYSKLILHSDRPTPITDLSHLGASGSLFAKAPSYIALPQDLRDYQASLQVLARLAKTAGHGLTQAEYGRGLYAKVDTDDLSKRHQLSIGPAAFQQAYLSEDIKAQMPLALRQALQGQSIRASNLLPAQKTQSAGLGADRIAVRRAAANNAPNTLYKGGVAATFQAGPRLIGVISSTPKTHFDTAISQLVTESHWNVLHGSVARWNDDKVLMAQTTQPATTALANLRLPTTKFEQSLAKLDLPAPTLALPDVNWPDMSGVYFTLQNLDWSKLKLSKINWTALAPNSKPRLRTEYTADMARPMAQPKPTIITSPPPALRSMYSNPLQQDPLQQDPFQQNLLQHSPLQVAFAEDMSRFGQNKPSFLRRPQINIAAPKTILPNVEWITVSSTVQSGVKSSFCSIQTSFVKNLMHIKARWRIVKAGDRARRNQNSGAGFPQATADKASTMLDLVNQSAHSAMQRVKTTTPPLGTQISTRLNNHTTVTTRGRRFIGPTLAFWLCLTGVLLFSILKAKPRSRRG